MGFLYYSRADLAFPPRGGCVLRGPRNFELRGWKCGKKDCFILAERKLLKITSFIQHLFIRNRVDDFPQYPQAVGLILHLHHFAFQCEGVLCDDGASTRPLFTVCGPVRWNLSAILFDVAIPRKSDSFRLMLEDHMMYFGDKDFLRGHLGAVDGILEYFRRHLDGRGTG